MARLSKPQLLEIIVQAIHESEWNVLYLSDSHPFRLQVYRGDESYRVKIYIWNMTHGGGAARPANEYRIQITGIGDRFTPEPGGKTLILGWKDQIGVFAGFDYRRHSERLGASPSIQIKEECLEQATETGFSPCDKGNQEIAIAFRPDFFIEYLHSLEQLHDFGKSEEDLAVLVEVAQHPEVFVNREDLPISDNDRKIVIATVNRRQRNSNFRRRVLRAYNDSCAFCGLQLQLVEAAHIIPVHDNRSTDQTCNGIALCSLHHRAFDQTLVTMIEDYRVITNDLKADELRKIDLDGGYQSFRNNLKPRINLPNVVNDRPHIDFIKLANQVRGWKQEQVTIS